MKTEHTTETTQTVKIADLDLNDIDLETLPKKRYEIHIKQDYNNFYFGITEVSFLAYNIMMARILPIGHEGQQTMGVFKTAEDAAAAALACLKVKVPDAEITVSVKTENDKEKAEDA